MPVDQDILPLDNPKGVSQHMRNTLGRAHALVADGLVSFPAKVKDSFPTGKDSKKAIGHAVMKLRGHA